jgi:hypothetical protein
MTCDWQKELQKRRPSAAATLPPALVEETGWDILLALHSDHREDLSVDKLGAIVSAPQIIMAQWLAALEERHLITGTTDMLTGQVRALLTAAGRELLDRYLSVTSRLQVSAQH